jgi:hypothetical protein
MKTQEEYERIIAELSESNYNLSMKLSNFRVNGHVSHLFGMPLNEVADIITRYDQEKQNVQG